MKTLGSVLLAAAAAIALAATPALAQNAPMKDAPMKGGDMKGMPMKSSAMPMKSAKPMKMALTCMDYAYQSQDEKDCEAGKIKPPSKHAMTMMKKAPAKPMAKTKS